MKNIEMNISADKLTVVVDLKKNFGKSKTGKSIIIATTEGNQSLPYKESMKMGLNIYKAE